MNPKLYVMRRSNFFDAVALKQIPDDSIIHAGIIWVLLALTDEEKNKFTFPLSPA